MRAARNPLEKTLVNVAVFSLRSSERYNVVRLLRTWLGIIQPPGPGYEGVCSRPCHSGLPSRDATPSRSSSAFFRLYLHPVSKPVCQVLPRFPWQVGSRSGYSVFSLLEKASSEWPRQPMTALFSCAVIGPTQQHQSVKTGQRHVYSPQRQP